VEIQTFFSPKNISNDNVVTAIKIARALNQRDILEGEGPFYPVIMGIKPAIYRSW
jgi:hypothetical protein